MSPAPGARLISDESCPWGATHFGLCCASLLTQRDLEHGTRVAQPVSHRRRRRIGHLRNLIGFVAFVIMQVHAVFVLLRQREYGLQHLALAYSGMRVFHIGRHFGRPCSMCAFEHVFAVVSRNSEKPCFLVVDAFECARRRHKLHENRLRGVFGVVGRGQIRIAQAIHRFYMPLKYSCKINCPRIVPRGPVLCMLQRFQGTPPFRFHYIIRMGNRKCRTSFNEFCPRGKTHSEGATCQ